MCHHAVFWSGELAGGKQIAAQKRVGHWAVRVTLCILLFVLCILLLNIVVVTVRFHCCSVQLPLSRPMSFCHFLSVLLRTPVGGGVIE